MTISDINDILPFVKKPSRYIGGEINSQKKSGPVPLTLALCFPDVYEIGTSHFGLQILYHILNKRSDIAAERVFAPGLDMAEHLKKNQIPLTSLESRQPLNKFDILGFSLLYELNYTNMLAMLDLAGLPFYAAQRDQTHPLVIAGGPCAFNPEPVADFFDAIIIGDGEAVITRLADIWLDCRRSDQAVDKALVLKRWSEIQGVYIPAYYTAGYDQQGRQRLTPAAGVPETVTRAFVPELNREHFPDKPVVPFGKPVHDRLRLEIARGCTRGCRFCQAGMIYRPVRERSVADTLTLADQALSSTGYDDISLLSLSTGDYGGLSCLMETLVGRYASSHIALSIPSFRAGTLNDTAMKQIRSIRKTGFTMAPEAGSQRLRNVINKNISEEEILETVNNAFDLGWNLIKAYFMIGLPSETEADLDAIVELVRRMAAVGKKKGKQKTINVSVATFVPKAHTPFQWEAQLPVKQAKDRLFSLKRRLSGRQFGFKWQNPEVSLIEGGFARGDRRLAGVVEKAYHDGCRFDGWSDSFDYNKWLRAAAECGYDFEAETSRPRSLDEPLPWGHILSGVSRDFLIRELHRAGSREVTPDCRDKECRQCGVCDFERIYPRLVEAGSNDQKPAGPGPLNRSRVDREEETPVKMTLEYYKKDLARYFGHLEFVNIMNRTMNRAGLPLQYSQGFHPKPRVAFGDPLPVGIESEAEQVTLTLSRPVRPEKVMADMNRHLPAGIKIKRCQMSSLSPPAGPKEDDITAYRIVLARGRFDPARLAVFFESENFYFTRVDRKGQSTRIDLRQVVSSLTVVDEKTVNLSLRTIPRQRVRPGEVITEVFDLPDSVIQPARIIKLGSGKSPGKSSR